MSPWIAGLIGYVIGVLSMFGWAAFCEWRKWR